MGGNPLTLKLAVDVAKYEAVGVTGITSLETHHYFILRLSESEIQGQLYRRILNHIHNPEVRKLAHPGLILRRITPDLILEVLAIPCGVDVPDIKGAQELFEELRREVSLIAPDEDGSLRHRQDVRQAMVDLLRRDEPAKVREIHERAIAY